MNSVLDASSFGFHCVSQSVTLISSALCPHKIPSQFLPLITTPRTTPPRTTHLPELHLGRQAYTNRPTALDTKISGKGVLT